MNLRLPIGAWQIDCLPKSGLLRVFLAGNRQIRPGSALSSFEIFVGEEE